MDQGPYLRFTSTAFPVSDGEDKDTSPGIFGRRLAEWLTTQLTFRGVNSAGMTAVKNGWRIAIVSEKPKLYVVCASDKGQSTSWKVFALADRPMFSRIDTGTPLGALYRTIRAILAENPSIKDLRLDHDG